MIFDSLNLIRRLRRFTLFCDASFFFIIFRDNLFQTGKDFATLTVTIVPEQQNEGDCEYAAE